MKKFCESIREHAMQKRLLFLKKNKNEVIIKRAAGIIRKCKNLLYLYKKPENKYLKGKKIL